MTYLDGLSKSMTLAVCVCVCVCACMEGEGGGISYEERQESNPKF